MSKWVIRVACALRRHVRCYLQNDHIRDLRSCRWVPVATSDNPTSEAL
jgi:hypothetical protein